MLDHPHHLYFPILLVSVTHNAVPNSSSFDTQPEGQIDYPSQLC